jgi:hypothetical protein
LWLFVGLLNLVCESINRRRVLVESARKEFDTHRHETDTETLAQLLLDGRAALSEVHAKV